MNLKEAIMGRRSVRKYKNIPVSEESTAAAIENMLLTAYEKGIGSCWMTSPLESGLDAALKEKFAPDKGKMVALLTFGYPDQEPKMPRRREGRYELII